MSRNHDSQTIGRNVDIFRKEIPCEVDQSHVVAKVSEVCLSWFRCFYNVESLIEVHVGEMFFLTKSIDDESIDIYDFIKCGCRHL